MSENDNGKVKIKISKSKYSKEKAFSHSGLLVFSGLLFFIFSLGLGFGVWTIIIGMFFVVAAVCLYEELNKIKITQESIDELKEQLVIKNPDANQETLNAVDVEKYNKSFLLRFLFWTHTLSSFGKILVWVMLPISFIAVIAGIIIIL